MPRKLNKEDLSKYNSTHMWLYRHFGKASKCEHCGNKEAKQYEWANISGKYKRERTDFLELCQSCHSKMDNAKKLNNCCRKGHDYLVIPPYIRKNDGYRQCRVCLSEAIKRYKNKKNEVGKSE